MKKILFMFLLFIPFFVYAECDSKVTISKLELDSKKGYAEELEQSSYECNNIKLNIKMYNKDDSIIYNLTIKNNSDDDVELNNVIDSKSEYIVYKIEDKDLIVEKGKEKTFKLSATYNKLVSPTLLVNGTVEDNQVMNLSVTTKEEKNPNTNNVGIILIVIVLLLSIMTTMLLVLTKKETPKYMSLLLIPVLLIPVIAYALTKFELKLEAKVVIGEPKEKAIEPQYVCKPATTLHTAICNKLGSCTEIMEIGDTITYGTLVSGTPKSGDAYDCDVNNDGVYDPETERFYYVTSDGEKSTLIYNINMNNPESYAYEPNNENWHGPTIAYQALPTLTEWSNPGLIAPGTRQIVAENGATSTKGGTIESFTYTDKAARFLTYQEIIAACGTSGIGSTGFFDEGYLNNCTWLMENIEYFTKFSSTRKYGYWLENPKADHSANIWIVNGQYRYLEPFNTANSVVNGVRPAIVVKNSSIEPDNTEVEEPETWVTYPTGKSRLTVEVGDIVSLGEEEFYVVKRDGEDLILLAHYNLNVDHNIVPNATEGIQNSEAKGRHEPTATQYGVVPFAIRNYWNNYPGGYCTNPMTAKNCIYVYDNNSYIYQYVEAYKTFLEGLGATIKSARLLKVEEASELGCGLGNSYNCNSAPSWIYETSYWLGSLSTNTEVWGIVWDGSIVKTDFNTNPYGVRPVIVI